VVTNCSKERPGSIVTKTLKKWNFYTNRDPIDSKRNYRLGHRDTNDDRDTGNINDDRNINGDAGGTGGIYK